jgi:RAT1-interacting protein
MSAPVMLGFYSFTFEDDYYEDSKKNIRVLLLPADLHHVSFDLTEGYVSLAEGGPVVGSYHFRDPGLKRLPMWILNNKDKVMMSAGAGGDSPVRLNADFVCSRGVLAKIMTTPYDKFSHWCIGATKFRGTIYLYELLTDARIRDDDNRDDYGNACTYGGHRFEDYITEHVHEPEYGKGKKRDFECVVAANIGGHKLVYNGEMDCLEQKWNAEKPSLNHFVEIKTTRASDANRTRYHLVRNKMIKWWAQSSLIGIEKIICGYRDRDLFVRQMEVFRVSDSLHRMGRQFWSPDHCYQHLQHFLGLVKETVREDDPRIMYEFTGEHGKDVKWIKTVPTTERHVIPDWYISVL